MSTSSGSDLTEPNGDPVGRLELLIRNTPNGDFSNARAVLRGWLFQLLNSEPEGSIGDALARLVTGTNFEARATAAPVLIRCSAVSNLLSPPNAANRLDSSITSLCQFGLPDLWDFLGLDDRRQTFENYPIVADAHRRIEQILSPLRDDYLDLEAILASRRSVNGALSHSIIRAYCAPFRLGQIKHAVESVFRSLARVAALDSSFLIDFDECQRVIQDATRIGEDFPSFLGFDFLLPFLNSATQALNKFLDRTRGRFSTSIHRGGNDAQLLQKRYPLHEVERELVVSVHLRNSGPGVAKSVRATAVTETDSIIVASHTIILGDVLPGDFSVQLDAMVIAPVSEFSLLLSIEWTELGDPDVKTNLFDYKVLAQRADIDWAKLEYWHPYSTDIAQGSNFIGRAESVSNLAAKLLRSPMEPFFITGQKRVGKTSLAFAVADFARARAQGSIEYLYILWGQIAHEDPRDFIRELGEQVQVFITSQMPGGVQLQSYSYNGTLAPLLKLATAAQSISDKRFVLIIDEFDDIHQDLFLRGNLAETFFGNLRALSTSKNITLVLVGGENMPFVMDRQGQKLNRFSRANVSYFSREREWADYQRLIRQPAQGTLNWHDDAIAEVFNITNGNPYFTKLICGAVARQAVRERDADVTAEEVQRATQLEVSILDSNSFAHLWQDGIHKPVDEREPDIVRRTQTLVAIARCLRLAKPVTVENIADSRLSASLPETEIAPVMHDFVRRDVLREEAGAYSFALPLFSTWLVDVGLNRLIADTLTEELATGVQAQEDAAHVRSEEVVRLKENWPTYRGKHIGTDEIRAWYQQVESNQDQRILFKILQNIRFVPETDIREKLRTAHAVLRPILPEFITRRLADRRRDVLITYVDGEGKSGQYYASQYAEENRISVDSIVNPAALAGRLLKSGADPAALVIIDDVAATGRSLSDNIETLIRSHGDVIAAKSLHVFVVALFATAEAETRILERIATLSRTIDFRKCELVGAANLAFHEDNKIWSSQDEFERAKALCTDLGSRIYRRNPLGYGRLGMLLVLPTTVPNNSLPILHSFSRAVNGKRWTPLFPRIVN